ncbi:MAG: cell division protein ZapA [Ruminococcus sp.]|nr:cell division protein ZapA [Ruminococcus sp.]
MDRQIIFVGGKRFTIVTDESEAYMKKLVERVDTRLKSIISSNPKLDKDSAAILASLDYCDEEYKLRQKLEDVKEQIKDYIEDTARLHKEIAQLKAQNVILQDKINKILNITPTEDKKTQQKEKKIIATGKIEHSVPKILDGAVQQSLFNNEKN